MSLSSPTGWRPLRRSGTAAKLILLPCAVLLLIGATVPARATQTSRPGTVVTGTDRPPAAIILTDISFSGPVKNPLGYTDDGQNDAGFAAADADADAEREDRPNLEPVLATPFAGAALSGGLHIRDRETYPTVGSAAAAELDLRYRF